MKISYNWLKEYIDFDLDPEKLSEILTACGLEVEGLEKFESVKGGLEDIVIGEVLTCEQHPNADKLSLTTVNIGTGTPLDIVCGAPNVDKGQKVVVAPIGARLYMDENSFQIKRTKIRGEVSEGMICAEDELGLGTSHDGIMVLDPSAIPGKPAKEYFDIQEDYVFEIGLTPNRSDATSHIGVARDLVSVLNQTENTRNYKLVKPDVKAFNSDNNNRHIDIEIEDAEACPRYTGITLSGIEVKESPVWLKNYLNAVGVRPINNIVDITNFVLFETGQPLHAFDADEIKGNRVIIKKLPRGATFTTLDEVERELTGNDLMICNAEDGMCIGGVFGGIKSGVTEETKNIFLESAYFDPVTIRKTSKHHGLQTDASFRFERGADPNITKYALKRAIMLMKDIAGGEISSDIVDVYPDPIDKWEVAIKFSHVDRLIGKTIDRDMISTILQDLGIEIKEMDKEGMLLLIPTFKVEVTREADVIEEILRIYGYDNIDYSGQLRSSLSFTPKPDPEKLQNLISDYLTANGFFEIMNNSLTNSKYNQYSQTLTEEKNVKTLNPTSMDLDVLRQGLIFGNLESVAYNQNRKNENLKFYEFGTIYKLTGQKTEDPLSKYFEEKHLSLLLTGEVHPESWATSEKEADFYLLKAYTENVFKKMGINTQNLSVREDISDDFNEGLTFLSGEKTLAETGIVHPSLLKSFDIRNAVYYADINWDLLVELAGKSKVQYSEIPKFPAVRRDLALLIDNSVKFSDIEEIASKTERHLLKSVNLFDVYAGKNIESGKKSYAISFILQHPEKTLTDKIIDKTMNKMMEAFKREIGAVIRQ